MDTLVFLFIYFTYCLIVYYVFLIPNIIVQRLLIIPALLPIVVGYFFSTFGFLALGWIVAEYAPDKEIRLSDQLFYREYPQGTAIHGGGTRIVVFESIPFLPFLESTALTKDINLEDLDIKLNELESTDDRLNIEVYSNNTLYFDTLVIR
ncbi:MAG: hypothetical protein AAF944_17760 [Bacteroidota bacterium]